MHAAAPGRIRIEVEDAGAAYPVTIERVAAWAATLDAKGIDLVPVSAIANRQAVR